MKEAEQNLLDLTKEIEEFKQSHADFEKKILDLEGANALLETKLSQNIEQQVDSFFLDLHLDSCI